MNHSRPAIHSMPMKAIAPTMTMRNRFASTKPPRRACQPLIRLLASHSGAAKNTVSSGGMTRKAISNPMPMEPGSSWLRSNENGTGNGAFQPPKNRVTVRAEMMNTFTYSAKKKNPKRMPEYSVAKPATISESASVRSNGVRFASAAAAMKKISAPSGWRKMYQSVNQPDCCSTMTFRLNVPASRIRPTTDSVSGIS